MLQMQELWAQIFSMKNKDIEPNRKYCESYIWMDYNTWCRCHYYGEFGHIGEKCVKHDMRTRDTTRRCFICTKLGHFAKNYMNTGRVEDEKKAKADNIIKQII